MRRGIGRHKVKVSIERKFQEWLAELKSFALREAEMVPDLTANYWRECFEDGMSPEIAFRESFAEQDGL